MTGQSLSFTKPNDKWIKQMVSSQEYSSKSTLVNDLIRQATNQQVKIEWLNRKLEKAEAGGFSILNKHEILKESIARLKG